MKRRILFALDFDFTIIDEDSDHWVFKKLSPELFERMSGSKMQWTDLCNMLFMELQDSFSMEQIASTLAQIPFNPSMKELLEKANVVGDIIIISDANTLYIDTITKAKGIRDCFHSVITNPTVIEGSKVSIKRRGQSSCPNSCAVNICKGKELLDFLAVNGPYDQICYIGDGLNDFCPGTKLKETDLFFPRNGFKLSSKLKNEVFRSQIVAKVYEWTDASDLKAYLERELPVFQ